jgi:hypothetical protein
VNTTLRTEITVADAAGKRAQGGKAGGESHLLGFAIPLRITAK